MGVTNAPKSDKKVKVEDRSRPSPWIEEHTQNKPLLLLASERLVLRWFAFGQKQQACFNFINPREI